MAPRTSRGEPIHEGAPRAAVEGNVRDVWARRLERARELSRLWPFAGEVLGFYSSLLEVQRAFAAKLTKQPPADVGALAGSVVPLLELTASRGPSVLAARASSLRVHEKEEWEAALRSFWTRGKVDPIDAFFARALLQPHAMALAADWTSRGETASSDDGVCPFCGHAPAVSTLREDASAGAVARSLVCSLCALEWTFPRVLCPGCREERAERLPRFTAEEIAWIRVEACETCGRYLKAVDVTKMPAAEPIVDELASTPLDVLARGEGFVKIEANLAGM